MKVLKLGALVLAALLGGSAVGNAAEADAAVTAFVARINKTTGAAQPGDKPGIRAACKSLVSAAFDFSAMAPATSDGTWKRMNAGQKQAYLAALSDRAAGDCARRGKEVAGKQVEVVGIRPGKNNERQIAVQSVDKAGRMVIWKVVPSGGGIRAIDIVVDGNSLVALARNQARQILASSDGNLNTLIRAIGR